MVEAPNQKNLRRKTIKISHTALRKGLSKETWFDGRSPCHWMTISSKQSMSMRMRLDQTHKSQTVFTSLLPLKWRQIAQSRSGWSPMWMTQRQQEQKLSPPITNNTARERAHPASRVRTGRIRMSPPIIPLTIPTTVSLELSLSPINFISIYQFTRCHHHWLHRSRSLSGSLVLFPVQKEWLLREIDTLYADICRTETVVISGGQWVGDEGGEGLGGGGWGEKGKKLGDYVDIWAVGTGNIIKILPMSMHFSKFMTVSQIQTNTQLISEQLNKSPLRPPNPRIEKTDHEHPTHVRTQSSFVSPTAQPSSYSPLGAQRKEFRTKSPVVSSQVLSSYRQEGQSYEFFNMRNRKRSENNIIYENEEHMIKSMVFTKPPPIVQSPTFRKQDKERKASCNLDFVTFRKKPGQKSSENDECPEIRSKAEGGGGLLKKKSLGWDQNNNFQFSTSRGSHGSDEQITIDMTRSVVDMPKMPRINNLRKHSDNDNVKKVPSFIAQSKIHRNSEHIPSQPKGIIDIHSFLILRELGKGAFGRVVLAVEKESKLVCAIKIMAKREIREDNMVQQLARELKIQTHINHPNIVKVYGFFADLLHFYIVMECALDGHLSDYMEKKVAPMFAQICSAVSLLHSTSIIHRDLKPENVMIHEGVVKICDFGWSVHRGGSLRTTFCGTPIYLCPEILVGDQYDESIDIWALGVILYEMLFKSNPFRITCKQELVNILNEPIHYDQSLPVSSCAKDIIAMCLSKRAVDRPNIRELQLHQFLIKLQPEQLKR